MNTATVQETPKNYIRFAAQNPRNIIAHQYREKLMALLLNSSDDAGLVFTDFRSAATQNQNLSSTFYAAVKMSFEQLHHLQNGYPLRWNGLMDAIATASAEDPTLQKYVREILLGRTIPTLVGAQSTAVEMQMASDILTAAGRHKNLQDAVTPQSVRPVVLWHLANAKHRFSWAATRLSMLRESAPFVPVIADIENKHGVHVDGQRLDNDPTQILLTHFDKARHSVAFSVMDTSKPGHPHEPRPIELANGATPHHDQIGKILLASLELPKQEWVAPIATEAYCLL